MMAIYSDIINNAVNHYEFKGKKSVRTFYMDDELPQENPYKYESSYDDEKCSNCRTLEKVIEEKKSENGKLETEKQNEVKLHIDTKKVKDDEINELKKFHQSEIKKKDDEINKLKENHQNAIKLKDDEINKAKKKNAIVLFHWDKDVYGTVSFVGFLIIVLYNIIIFINALNSFIDNF